MTEDEEYEDLERRLNYKPKEQAMNKQQRPQNCGTGYCSCIECPYEQPAQQWVDLTDPEIAKLSSLYRHSPAALIVATQDMLRLKNKGG